MDKNGYELIKAALGDDIDVQPEPSDAEDIRFIELSFKPTRKRTVASLLIKLDDADLYETRYPRRSDEPKPCLRRRGEYPARHSFLFLPLRQKVHLVLEDLNT